MNSKSIWPSLHPDPNVAIIGANGGIGKALTQYIET
jgi:NADPH:quinone reductase-like Zn-dependent oxidoreductase